ncbi:hypothetical protein ACW9UM_18635 (plasmid) [Marinovum sp. KMM 9989]
MLRILIILPVLFFALSLRASGDEVYVYSGNFSYASQAEAHLGGDDFMTTSVRIDHGTNRAETAQFTASGRIVSLDHFDLKSSGKPRLPKRYSGGGDPGGSGPLVEGSGPVGLAAQGNSARAARIRMFEPTGVSSMREVSGWATFDAELRNKTGNKIASDRKGIYLQLRPREAQLSWPEAKILSRDDLRGDPVLSTLFGAPFAFIPIGGNSSLSTLNPALRLEVGTSRQFTYERRLFIITRYDFR